MNTTAENVLNVTLLEPRMKHPTIFARFDELLEGESLTIHNDHDPKPLYYQLLGERGNVFSWEYLENGPIWWKVRIGKNKTGEAAETLGEIVTKDLRKAQIFKKFGLDFCCGGKKTVKEACAEKGIDVTLVETELLQASRTVAGRALPYNEWSLDFLADYIVQTHHAFVKNTLPDMKMYAAKVAKVHGAQHSELARIEALVEEISAEFESHMDKEENVLFPYIKAMVMAKNTLSPLKAASFGSVKSPITMMEMEHENAGKIMEEIRALSNDYQLPQDACASYGLLYKLLSDFEEDLHLHVHLENNILFPKAQELEKTLLA